MAPAAAPFDVLCLWELQTSHRHCSYCAKRARAAHSLAPCRNHDHAEAALKHLAAHGFEGRLHRGSMRSTAGIF